MVHGKYNRYDSPRKEIKTFEEDHQSLTALSKTIINVDHSSSPTAHFISAVFILLVSIV